MSDLTQFVKKALIVVVVLLAIFISLASMLVFVVDALGIPSFPAPTIENAAKVQTIYGAEKARLEYLFQPIDKMSALLQIIAATAIAYVFTRETVPALARVVATARVSRQQDRPFQD